jgi:hypothetical protein
MHEAVQGMKMMVCPIVDAVILLDLIRCIVDFYKPVKIIQLLESSHLFVNAINTVIGIHVQYCLNLEM